MKKIYFGSQDSLDIDVVYIFDIMPNLQECKSFCSEKEENRNIICINNGVVTDSYKGTVDEMNNVVFNTFTLHQQILEENPIKFLLTRDIPLKCIRTVRGLLSSLSRTKYREEIKRALKSPDWNYKLEVLDSIKLIEIYDFVKDNKIETFKFLAFQIGQTLDLIYGKETFTKKDVVINYPLLNDFLYRKEDIEKQQYIEFELFYHNFIGILKQFNIENIKDGEVTLTYFNDFLSVYDLKNEIKIEEINLE